MRTKVVINFGDVEDGEARVMSPKDANETSLYILNDEVTFHNPTIHDIY